MTNFRTMRDKNNKIEYESRGTLVMDFVKINDDDIPEEDKITIEDFQWKLYEGKFRGFNFIFGNILDNDTSREDAGQLKYFQN